MRTAAFDYSMEADRFDSSKPTPLHMRPASAVSEQDTKDQEDKTKIEAREAAIFWRGCLKDTVGRREILKVLRLSGAFENSPFAADLSGRQNDRLTDYKMGQLSIGHSLYQMLAIVARAELFKLQDEENIFGHLAVRPDKEV